MIHESSYWKDSLTKHAEFINLKLRQRRWTDASFGRLEEAVVMSCFIVRKLNESKKIDARHCAKELTLRRFPSTGKTPTVLNSHRLFDLYEGSSGNDVKRPLSFVLNQLIHSFVLAPVFSRKNEVKYYAFNSDYTKNSELYLAALKDLAQSFAEVSDSYLSSVTIFNVGPNGALTVAPTDQT